jgi:hypothetical protein
MGVIDEETKKVRKILKEKEEEKKDPKKLKE